MAKQFQVDTDGTLLTSLVAYYKLEDANDYFGSQNLTATSITFSAAKIDNGAVFNATSDRLQDASGLLVDLSGNASISFWAKFSVAPTSGQSRRLLDWREITGTARYLLLNYVNTAGVLGLNLDLSGGSASYNVDLGTTNPHHFILTYASGGAFELYLDNVLVATGTRGTGTSGDNFTLGNATDASIAINGWIDEVAVHSKVYSAQERADLYNGGSGQTMVDVVASGAPRLPLLGVGS